MFRLCKGWGQFKNDEVVGGLNPSKNMKVSWDDEIPNIWEKCSKPPTSECSLIHLNDDIILSWGPNKFTIRGYASNIKRLGVSMDMDMMPKKKYRLEKNALTIYTQHLQFALNDPNLNGKFQAPIV